MNKYYVYRHIRLDTNTPFYVGKGCNKRAYKKDRNSRWRNIYKKTSYRVEILKEDLTELESLKMEIKLIKLYKNYGHCEANLTDGGEGMSGFKWTEKQKKNIA